MAPRFRKPSMSTAGVSDTIVGGKAAGPEAAGSAPVLSPIRRLVSIREGILPGFQGGRGAESVGPAHDAAAIEDGTEYRTTESASPAFAIRSSRRSTIHQA